MRRCLALACAFVPLACGGSGGPLTDAGVDAARPPFTATCQPGSPAPGANLPAGRQQDGSVILPGGRRLTPAGTVLPLGGFPIGLRLLPDDRYVVVTDTAQGDQALRLVDTRAADPQRAVVAKHDYPLGSGVASPALFYGLALSADGKRLFVANGGHDPAPLNLPGIRHYNTIDFFDLPADNGVPRLVRDPNKTIRLYFNPRNAMDGSADPRLPAGLALSSDEKRLYAATQYDGTLAIVDVTLDGKGIPGLDYGKELARAPLPGIGPYDVAVDERSRTAFVSLWDGAKLGGGQWIDGVAVVDLTNELAPVVSPQPLATGKASEAELLLAGKLYVVNADADTLSVVDAASRAVRSSRVTAGALLGASPNHLAIDEKNGRLYIANAGENAVVALDLQTLQILGRIPTAWYPTAVAVRRDGALVIAAAKGLGFGPTKGSFGWRDYAQGVIQVVPFPDGAALKKGDQVVQANLYRMRDLEPQPSCAPGQPPRFPVPPDEVGAEVPIGVRSPIEHVFFFVRENRTYDQVLGDMKEGNGDPSMTLFGETVTPNGHALAREFVLLDNCYIPAEKSIQGHIWTTSCAANDYAEKASLTTSGRGYRPGTAFGGGGLFERLAHPGSGSIFTHLDAHGVAYHNYGEIANTLGAKRLLDPLFPGVAFNNQIRDGIKVDYVIETALQGPAPPEPFSYIGLPNDHTFGTAPGKPTPQSMVAENDEALGRFVDTLSRSPYWERSLVIAIEDDPQDGGDHVEAHRTVCLLASPWLKRHQRSSFHYDIGSIYRTIERILGVPPIALPSATASSLTGLFVAVPDKTPYSYIPRKVPMTLNAADAPMAEESARIDWSRPDTAPLGRILWKAVKGAKAEPPWGRHDSPLWFAREGDDD